jgi:hypothetical protein
MIKQLTSKGPAPSPMYVTVNVASWVIYVALVVLATQVLRFHSTVAVAASVLVAAAVFYPLRRRAQRAARRRFDHRRPGFGRPRHGNS